MKKLTLPVALFLALLVFGNLDTSAQEKSTAQKFEYAIAKWDGPDRIQYMLPDKYEEVRLGTKFPRPDGAREEEYYLAKAANELAKQGWEAVGFDSRRILFRRPVGK